MNKIQTAFCAGVFDSTPDNLPHSGHLFLLNEMRKLVGPTGQVIIGLNSDGYIIDYKKRQPLSSWLKRRRALYESRLVNEVHGFYCNPIDLIMMVKPDFLITGSDYNESQIIGAQEIKQWGGRTVIIERLPGISTSQIIQNLNK
jgi:D-beta-D-heptose 7-phosphate kinase/D-beta-D-heptose 1-phosphate adenosyltransferase